MHPFPKTERERVCFRYSKFQSGAASAKPTVLLSEKEDAMETRVYTVEAAEWLAKELAMMQIHRLPPPRRASYYQIAKAQRVLDHIELFLSMKIGRLMPTTRMDSAHRHIMS